MEGAIIAMLLSGLNAFLNLTCLKHPWRANTVMGYINLGIFILLAGFILSKALI